MAEYNPRDRSRTAMSMSQKLRVKHRRPPDGERWYWMTEEMIFSPAFTALSVNAYKVLFRIVGEFMQQGLNENGRLIVTHADFRAYGVTGTFVADAIDELVFKGLIRVRRGRAADGTPHPNLYRLTMYGDVEGTAATNDWKRTTFTDVQRWDSERLQRAEQRRKRAGRKKNPRSTNVELARSTNVELPAVSRSAAR